MNVAIYSLPTLAYGDTYVHRAKRLRLVELRDLLQVDLRVNLTFCKVNLEDGAFTRPKKKAPLAGLIDQSPNCSRKHF